MEAKNRAELRITTYGSDLAAFAEWLTEHNLLATTVDQVERADITDYLAILGNQDISGTTRAKMLASIRELYRYLVKEEQLGDSRADRVDTLRALDYGGWLSMEHSQIPDSPIAVRPGHNFMRVLLEE